MSSDYAEYLESIGFSRNSNAPDEDVAWSRDVPGGFRELRTDGRQWWPAMLGDYGTKFEDEWVGESFESPMAAFVYAEVDGWGES